MSFTFRAGARSPLGCVALALGGAKAPRDSRRLSCSRTNFLPRARQVRPARAERLPVAVARPPFAAYPPWANRVPPEYAAVESRTGCARTVGCPGGSSSLAARSIPVRPPAPSTRAPAPNSAASHASASPRGPDSSSGRQSSAARAQPRRCALQGQGGPRPRQEGGRPAAPAACGQPLRRHPGPGFLVGPGRRSRRPPRATLPGAAGRRLTASCRRAKGAWPVAGADVIQGPFDDSGHQVAGAAPAIYGEPVVRRGQTPGDRSGGPPRAYGTFGVKQVGSTPAGAS
jgi:hypothetical protein